MDMRFEFVADVLRHKLEDKLKLLPMVQRYSIRLCREQMQNGLGELELFKIDCVCQSMIAQRPVKSV